jgi:hypothetical protein
LLLGEISDAIDEGEGGFEVGKFEGAGEVMFVDNVPFGRMSELLMDFSERGAAEGRNSSTAGDAVAVGKHKGQLLSLNFCGQCSPVAGVLSQRILYCEQGENSLTPSR